MKKILILFVGLSLIFSTSCEGPQGPPGPPGRTAESEVFELRDVDFRYDPELGYNIFQNLSPALQDFDVMLIYRLSGTIDTQTPIWQPIPRTLYLPQGELDYDFDFSEIDFTIYAGGTYDLAFSPSYIQSQTFRIVIIPGNFYGTGKSANNIVDTSDYNAVIKAYNIDDSHVKILNK